MIIKTTAKFKGYSFDKENNIELTLTIDKKYMKQVIELENTHNDKYFNLTTNDRVSQRSERQNNATWKLIRMINEKEHGETNRDLENELYCNILKFARISVDILQCVYFDEEETKKINEGTWDKENKKWIEAPKLTPLQRLQKRYRVVEVTEIRDNDKGKSCILFLYDGLSGYSKEENTQFIKVLLDYAGKMNLGVTLETEELRSLLK